ncbi:hypothetical protein P8N37_000823 [Acinetobacter baumannii]|uniref:hypothetical protein n=1 Tax=Acinetobacter baumannii TaxID=470 RepID=UPI00259F8D2E|nr:hypothetical protein [Acinetobacter baumannii]
MTVESNIEDARRKYIDKYGTEPEFVLIEADAASFIHSKHFNGGDMANNDYTLKAVNQLSGCIPLLVPKYGHEFRLFEEKDLLQAMEQVNQGNIENRSVKIMKEVPTPWLDSSLKKSIANYKLEVVEIPVSYIDVFMTYKESKSS